MSPHTQLSCAIAVTHTHTCIVYLRGVVIGSQWASIVDTIAVDCQEKKQHSFSLSRSWYHCNSEHPLTSDHPFHDSWEAWCTKRPEVVGSGGMFPRRFLHFVPSEIAETFFLVPSVSCLEGSTVATAGVMKGVSTVSGCSELQWYQWCTNVMMKYTMHVCVCDSYSTRELCVWRHGFLWPCGIFSLVSYSGITTCPTAPHWLLCSLLFMPVSMHVSLRHNLLHRIAYSQWIGINWGPKLSIASFTCNVKLLPKPV